MTTVASIEQLEALYDQPPVEHSISKVLDRLNPEYRRVIEASPFFALATVGPEGMDCSPRGDRASAVHIVDDATVHIPDRRGNNRLDSLRNIVVDGRLALLFLVPGVSECLRINGNATLSADVGLRTRYRVGGNEPKSVIVVTVGSVYFQCARAIRRSELWNPARHVDPATVPTAGQMTKAASTGNFDAETYDAELADRQAKTLY
ncbi:MAG: pyridoxamine 5'-phosphate oxidase family protein [Acidimicrobiales bacterium]